MVGRFVDGLKAVGVEFFADVPVKFTCGCPLSIPDVARPPRPCRKGEGALATACSATTYHNVFFIPKNCIKNVCPLKSQWK